MKNCISRRSFLKAAGILGAAGALAACGGSSASTSTAASSWTRRWWCVGDKNATEKVAFVRRD